MKSSNCRNYEKVELDSISGLYVGLGTNSRFLDLCRSLSCCKSFTTPYTAAIHRLTNKQINIVSVITLSNRNPIQNISNSKLLTYILQLVVNKKN